MCAEREAERHKAGVISPAAGSPGLAPDALETEAITRARLPASPQSQAASRRLPASPANELLCEDVVIDVQYIARGNAPGPSGMHPEFLHAAVGATGEKPGAAILVGVCDLLADGRAPKQLRPFIAGARGTALAKKVQDGHS